MKMVRLCAPLLLLFLPSPSHTAAVRHFRPQPDNFRFSQPSFRWKRVGLFADADPLLQMRRRLEGLTTNVGRSMKSLLDAGSVLGQRMLGLSAGLNPLNIGFGRPPPPPHHDTVLYEVDHGNVGYPVDNQYQHPPPDCNCSFGPEDEVIKFEPVDNNYVQVDGEYGSPAAPVQESYGSPVAPVEESYGSPEAPAVTPPASPIPLQPVEEESPLTLQQVLDTPTSNLEHAVVLGAASVVQGASAPFPDQNNPHKYESHDPEHVNYRLKNTLYYNDLTELKKHLEGKKGKVRHHLKPVFRY